MNVDELGGGFFRVGVNVNNAMPCNVCNGTRRMRIIGIILWNWKEKESSVWER